MRFLCFFIIIIFFIRFSFEKKKNVYLVLRVETMAACGQLLNVRE